MRWSPPFFLLCIAAASVPMTAPLHAQGPLAPPGPPAATQKSLQEIWDKLQAVQSTVALQQQQINLLTLQNNALLEASGVVLPWQFKEVAAISAATPPGSLKPSLAFSLGGVPSIAYNSGGDLKFAVMSGAAWTAISVPGSGGITGTPSLAYAPTGHALIAYHGAGTTGLMFAEFDGSDWMVTQIDDGDTGYDPSLAIAPDGTPGIAYDDPEDSRLCFARLAAGDWEFETVTTDFFTGRLPSLAFRSDGMPGVAFVDRGRPGPASPDSRGIYFAIRESDGDWSQDKVIARGNEPDDREYSSPSLAFSPNGLPGIAYESYDNEGVLCYAAGSFDLSWDHQVICSAGDWGFSPTLAFTPSGMPAVGFITAPEWDETPSSISYAVLKGATWDLSYAGRVILDRFDTLASMAFTPAGQPAIAYSNSVTHKVSYAVRGGTTSP